MARIIVAGDSWSCSQISTNPRDWQGAYTADLSVANRLRSLGHKVYEVSSCGSSIKEQLHTLNGLFADQRWDMQQAVDYVLLGWTEWTRGSATLGQHKPRPNAQSRPLLHQVVHEDAG